MSLLNTHLKTMGNYFSYITCLPWVKNIKAYHDYYFKQTTEAIEVTDQEWTLLTEVLNLARNGNS